MMGYQMQYKKINILLMVVADEAEAVVAELNAALDQMEEKHTLFGGAIETEAFEHTGTAKRSALAHTIAAGETVVAAVRTARDSVAVALHAVI
jgi:cytidine deaminase